MRTGVILKTILLVLILNCCFLTEYANATATFVGYNNTGNNFEQVGLVSGFNDNGEWSQRTAPAATLDITYGFVPFGLEVEDTASTQFTTAKISCSPDTDATTWYTLFKDFTTNSNWTNADGLRVILATDTAQDNWISVRLYIGETVYTQYLNPRNYTQERVFEERYLPFSDFLNIQNEDTPLDPDDIPNIDHIKISGECNDSTFYFYKLFLYKDYNLNGSLAFTTNHTTNNLFEPGETVSLNFAIHDSPDAQVKGFDYEIKDYANTIVAQNHINFITGQNDYTATYTPIKPGYYELRVYFTDNAGNRLYPYSSLHTTGSMLKGLGTFAVMPSTLLENRERVIRVGEDGFFGLAPNRNRSLIEYMGFTWDPNSVVWYWQERLAQPHRSSGLPEWAQTMVDEGPTPAHIFEETLVFGPSDTQNIPDWAYDPSVTSGAPVYDIDDYYAFLKDTITVRKARNPQMTHHEYDLLDEIWMNTPKYTLKFHKPDWSISQINDFFVVTKAFILEHDPTAKILGPQDNPYAHYEFFEELMTSGFLDQIDAYTCHLYHQAPAETSGVLTTIRDMKTLIQANQGAKDIPLYQTEQGYELINPNPALLRAHAQWHARFSIILKGEGFKKHYLHFDRDTYMEKHGRAMLFGLNFNLLADFGFHSVLQAPKPAVPALATVAKMLDGFDPIEDYINQATGKWGYKFQDGDHYVIAVWSPSGSKSMTVPLDSNATNLKLTNIMGHESALSASGNTITVTVNESPQYISYTAIPTEEPSFPTTKEAPEPEENTTPLPEGEVENNNIPKVPELPQSPVPDSKTNTDSDSATPAFPQSPAPDSKTQPEPEPEPETEPEPQDTTIPDPADSSDDDNSSDTSVPAVTTETETTTTTTTSFDPAQDNAAETSDMSDQTDSSDQSAEAIANTTDSSDYDSDFDETELEEDMSDPTSGNSLTMGGGALFGCSLQKEAAQTNHNFLILCLSLFFLIFLRARARR
jgi:hypothetical protein